MGEKERLLEEAQGAMKRIESGEEEAVGIEEAEEILFPKKGFVSQWIVPAIVLVVLAITLFFAIGLIFPEREFFDKPLVERFGVVEKE